MTDADEDLKGMVYLSDAGYHSRVLYFLFGFLALGILLAFASPLPPETVLLGMSLSMSSWVLALPVGGFSVFIFVIAARMAPESAKYVAAVSLALFVLQFVHQMGGALYMNAFYFVGLAVLMTYRNWQTLALFTLLVGAHHIAFNRVVSTGVEDLYLYRYIGEFPLQIMLYNILAMLTALLAAVWWANESGEQILDDARSIMQLEVQIDRLTDDNRQVEYMNESIQQQLMAQKQELKDTLQALQRHDQEISAEVNEWRQKCELLEAGVQIIPASNVDAELREENLQLKGDLTRYSQLAVAYTRLQEEHQRLKDARTTHEEILILVDEPAPEAAYMEVQPELTMEAPVESLAEDDVEHRLKSMPAEVMQEVAAEWRLDFGTMAVTAEAPFWNMLGLEPQKPLALHTFLRQTVRPDDARVLQKTFRELFVAGGHREVGTTYHDGNGTEVRATSTMDVESDEGGKASACHIRILI